ncbi:MAG: NUDIX domain-containing protein [Patescibacteria group bacterium]|nr:NUDIX domain-containing protein [Patescibacteria group bacterium]
MSGVKIFAIEPDLHIMIIPTVAVLILKGNKVLLVKHGPAARQFEGVMGLPSGHVEKDETEIQAAIRELKEETGLEAATDDLKEFPNNYHVARIPLKDGSNNECGWRVYLCQNYSGQLQATEETEPVWVNVNFLDGLRLLPNVKDAAQAGLVYLNNQN